MKCLKNVFVMGALVLGLISCKKDEVSIDLSGTWEGTWGFGTEIPSNNEMWELDESGLITAYVDGYLYALGEWEVDGKEFTAEYTPLGATYSYIFSGICGDPDEMSGNWGQAPSTTDGGKWEMNRLQ